MSYRIKKEAEIEAKRAASDVERAESDLEYAREKARVAAAANRAASLGPEITRNVPVSANKAAATSSLGAYPTAAVDAAVGRARAEERERCRRVFASTASRGRERLAASLLSSAEGWPADAIIAKLPRVADAIKARATGAADATWDKAHGAAKQDSAPAQSESTDAAWDRAYGLGAGA